MPDVLWLNPLAWSGLVLLAVPVLIHLLSRQPPRSDVFPSLRFLKASPLRPTRRARLSDWWLLLIRCAIVIAAVAALAQPISAIPKNSDADSAPDVSSVTILDTTTVSAPIDTTGARVLRRSATELRHALQEAVASLRTQAAPRAITIRSAFPAFSLDSVDIAALPADVRLTLESHTARVPQVSQSTSRDTINWVTALDSANAERVVRTVADAGGDLVRVSRTASADTAVNRTTVVTSTNAAARAVYLQQTTANNQATAAWARLQGVAQSEALATLMSATSDSAHFAPAAPVTPLQFTANGQTAVSGIVRGSHAVALSHVAERPNIAVALLLAASSHARQEARDRVAPQGAALVDTTTLRRWSTLPSGLPIGNGNAVDLHSQPTLSRIFWLMVLALLALEHFVRSRRPARSTLQATEPS
ncbi:MAG: BatA domain-containing protein [Gemmatimonadaceae bacterium]|nr:BatA domain-containing protein [Gemmatimonadaceae bacterium]